MTTGAERSFLFGEASHLVGTLSPAATAPGVPVRDVGVVLMNAGVIHRIGPHRINVKLARSLAANGFPVLRFDVSGLGDSGREAGDRSMAGQAQRDLGAAMDRLSAESGVRRMLLIGVCSGAEYSYLTACADARVTGLVMIDGYSHPTLKSRFLRYGLRIATLTWPVFRQALRSRFGRISGHRMPAPGSFGLPILTAAEFGKGLAALVGRGADVYLIFTGSILQRYNHAGQFRETMRAAPGIGSDAQAAIDRVRCDYLPSIDHTVTSLAAQYEVIARIVGWIDATVRR